MCWKYIPDETFLKGFSSNIKIKPAPNHQSLLSNVEAKDVLLCGMTFMLSCRPILSPGVARRQEHPHCKRILGNDGTRKWILPISGLLSAFQAVVLRVNGREKCYANGPLVHWAGPFQYLLCPACVGEHCLSSLTEAKKLWDLVFRCKLTVQTCLAFYGNMQPTHLLWLL